MLNFTSAPDMLLEFEIAALESGNFLVEVPAVKFQETFAVTQSNEFLAAIVHSVAEHFENRHDSKFGQQFVVIKSDDNLQNGGKFTGLFAPENKLEWN